MNRDDVVTFGLALVAAVITFLVVSGLQMGGTVSFALAFVIFGVFLVVKSFVGTLYE
ncbi:hypothetical protein [Haladaptatus halobius]|jgi:hypothetical protein|uniref:hypothetical protein n=1 Tax=Haladaptatus halobius TaxID=2884875 RepID=UPI001D0A1321|nr:hypothetical protein [Haladaptatus halobius]